MNPDLSVVVIGRNEGQRLLDCLHSVACADLGGLTPEVLYVDSASRDDSPRRAARTGARVIPLLRARPCAAAGRNAGWRAARGRYILFLDGDTELDPDFIPKALREMRASPQHAVVWGHRRESHPEHSLFNRVLDLDWIYPPGDSAFCGGDALFRRSALEASDGFNEGLIAGEEPELCARLRGMGLKIRHIDAPMTRHDLAMHHWRQYWTRAERAGHAYAEIPHRLRASGDTLWCADARRNRIHAALLLAGLFLLSSLLLAHAWGPALLLASCAAGLVLRSAWRARWKCREPLTLLLYALHSQLQQIPILWGQLRWAHDQRRGQLRGLIDYKEGA